MLSRFLKMALLLGLLSAIAPFAIAPFAIDMYLPATWQSLEADIGAVQMSLTTFFLSLGIGQLLYVGLVFIGGFALAAFFVYLANSSFVMIDHYGLSRGGLQRDLRRQRGGGHSARLLERAL